jgi:hypothetical protein
LQSCAGQAERDVHVHRTSATRTHRMHLLTFRFLCFFFFFTFSASLGDISRTSRRHKTWRCTDLSPVTFCATVACEETRDWTGHGPTQAGDAVCSGSTLGQPAPATSRTHEILHSWTSSNRHYRDLLTAACRPSCCTLTPPANLRHRRQDWKAGIRLMFHVDPSSWKHFCRSLREWDGHDARNPMANLAGRVPERRP